MLFDCETIQPVTCHRGLILDRIYVSNKKAILQKLSRLNIKPGTIYRGIEETTRENARRRKVEETLNRLK